MQPAVSQVSNLRPPRANRKLTLRLFCSLSIALPLGLALTEPDTDPPAHSALPFHNLRESTLDYHGPSDDFNGLTELRIGWFGPTNLDDPLTGDLWWAANHAIHEANASLPISDLKSQISNPPPLPSPISHIPFRLIPRWSVDPWGTGVSQLTRMVYEDQPIALIGSIDSATTHLAEQVVAKANLPLVSPIATDPSVTLAGVPWMFACAPSDAAVARVLVDDILNPLRPGATEMLARASMVLCTNQSVVGCGSRMLHFGISPNPQSPVDNPQSPIPSYPSGFATPLHTSIPWGLSLDCASSPWSSPAAEERVPAGRVGWQPPRLALLTATDHESRMTTREVLREFSKRQRPPEFRFEVPPGAADITRQLSALADARPSVVLLIAGVEDTARLARAIRSLSAPTATLPSLLPAPMLFASQSAARTRFRELAGNAADGIHFPLLAATCGGTPTDADAARFTEAFLAARGHPPDDAALLTYDAARLLLEAIHRAGPNRDRVRAALAALSPWPGIAGVIHFDGTGQNTRTNVRMATLRPTTPTTPTTHE